MKKQTHTHEFNVLRLSGLREDQVYTIGDLGCLAAHVFFLVSFSVLGIVPMAAYNVFSVGFYAVMPFVIRKTKNRTPLMFLVMPEIMLHTLLAVIILGWTPGFSMYLIYIMAIPFLMPLKRVWVPYLFSGLCVVEFIALRIFCGSGYSPVYALSDSMTLVYYLVNTFSGAVIIIYIASIYMFYREIMQRRLISKNESLQQLASVDPLTQLFNRRSMTDFLKRIKESGKPYTIGLGDIDDFKKVNDSFGHDSGDEALKAASRVMRRLIPAEGYISRWGGEEFLFVIPDCGLERGREYAEKIRQALASEMISSESGSFRVTITIGVCEGAPGADYEPLISIADSRLYEGKRSGKNIVKAS